MKCDINVDAKLCGDSQQNFPLLFDDITIFNYSRFTIESLLFCASQFILYLILQTIEVCIDYDDKQIVLWWNVYWGESWIEFTQYDNLKATAESVNSDVMVIIITLFKIDVFIDVCNLNGKKSQHFIAHFGFLLITDSVDLRKCKFYRNHWINPYRRCRCYWSDFLGEIVLTNYSMSFFAIPLLVQASIFHRHHLNSSLIRIIGWCFHL